MKRTKLTQEEKEANKLAKREQAKQAKELNRINDEMNQKPIKQLNIIIEWRKSRTWGNCPRAYAEVSYHNGTFERTNDKYYASGCGYDKESTVIAEIFNDFLKYKLWGELIPVDTFINGGKSVLPYGIYIKDNYRSFSGGIGVNCYYKISQAIGGKFENISSGKSFDVYRYTDNN